jgi:hypothetical protein
LLVPLLFVAAVAGTFLVQFGLPMVSAEYVTLGLIGGYLLWFHWFIVRTGLVLGRGQAAFLVVITGVVIALFTAGPFLLDYAITGSLGLPQG